MSVTMERAVSRLRVVEPGYSRKGGIEAVVDGGSDDDVLRSGGEHALLEIFGHQEIVVELEMAAMLLGFCAESDNDDGVGRENTFCFVPRERFQKDG